MVSGAGGRGIVVAVDHLEPVQVAASSSALTPSRAVSTCSSTTSGAPSTSSNGTRRCGRTTSTAACGSCAWRETPPHHQRPRAGAVAAPPRRPGRRVTDGTSAYNAAHYRVSLFYDLA